MYLQLAGVIARITPRIQAASPKTFGASLGKVPLKCSEGEYCMAKS